MKQIASLISALVLVIGLIGCGEIPGGGNEGWVDENTFRVKGTGFANDINTDAGVRKWKYTSEDAALREAREKIVVKIVGSYIESTGANENAELIGKVVKEKAAGALRGTSQVGQTEYDASNKSATVVVELKSNGLKKYMSDLIKQYLEEVKSKGTASRVAGDK